MVYDINGNGLTSDTKSAAADANCVYCWGDSLTEGVGGWDSDNYIFEPWTNELSRPHVNLGCRGEDIQTIMARQGADPIVLTEDITIPASKDEAVTIGTCTMPYDKYNGVGLTTKSGERAKPLIEHEAGINPCKIGGVEGTLYREMTSSIGSDDTLTYKFKRLKSGDAVTAKSGSEIETYAMQHYRNGYAVIWMGVNGRANSHQQFAAKVKEMVEYGGYKNYVCVISREYVETWVEDGDGWQGIKTLLTDSNGVCHLLYLKPELIKRGYMLAGLSTQSIDTSSWTTTDEIVKAAPKLMATNTAYESGYEELHFSKWGYKAIGKLIEEKLTAVIDETEAANG